MIVVTQVGALLDGLKEIKLQSDLLSLIPTMGNLHDGHLSLIRKAKQISDNVVVSIFINPMQFNNDEDLKNYPRTLAEDLKALQDEGVSLVFTPREQEIYPNGFNHHTTIHVPILSQQLCGANRQHHFEGVCTVVYKLFQLIRPDFALFGEKDLQQLLIIKKMVHDLRLGITIIGVPTIRYDDGLALSSRNQNLSRKERFIAPLLWEMLTRCAEQINSDGYSEAEKILSEAAQNLTYKGFSVEYLELRNLKNLSTIKNRSDDGAIFTAAWLGDTRLIDNIRIKSR